MNRSGQPPEWPIDPDAANPEGAAKPGRPPFNPVLIALAGLLLVGIVLWLVTGNRNPDQDKLTNRNQSSTTAASPEKLCASTATYDLIKRDLFRRAAQLRGSDQAAFDRLSSFAVVRMENPVMESNNPANAAVECSGSLSLDLPPGDAVVGGRRTLTADVDYGVQPAADGSGNVVLLRNADAIITPLATLARVNEPQPTPQSENVVPEQAPGSSVPETPPSITAPEPTTPRPAPAVPSVPGQPAARPSFNCAAVNPIWSEIAPARPQRRSCRNKC